jgi:pilus assembly protein CpaB
MLRIVILIAALTAGGGAAWMVVALRGEPAAVVTTVSPAPPVALQDVLVASADLGVSKRLAKENMRWQSWPESALTPGYITKSARPDALETLVGSIVRSRMLSGEPIRDANLAQLRYSVKFSKVGRMDVVDISVENPN